MAEHEVAHAPRARTVQRGGGFPVEADDLLMVGDDAGLLDGLAVAGDDDAVGRRPEGAERPPEVLSRGVVPDDPTGGSLPAERGDVAHHVARAARSAILRGHGDDRYRGFRRDALHAAPHELVEHEIAHHEHPHASEPPDELVELSCAHAHGASP